MLVAVAALALALLTGHGPKFGPLAANQDQNRARSTGAPLAAVALATYPGQQQRGVFQTINRVVASGNTIVTIGSQTSDLIARQQFFVSANGGATWQLAPVHAVGGGQPALGYPALLAAVLAAGWQSASRPSGPARTGLTWTLAATHGIEPPATPRRPGMGAHQDRRRVPRGGRGAGRATARPRR